MTAWPATRYSLLARLADGDDHAAWTEFERIYRPAVYRYARSRGLQQADALEVVQEVMLAVHRAVAEWRPSHRPGSFRAWLAEATRRLTFQVIRQRTRLAPGGAVEPQDLGSIAAHAEDSEELEHQRWLFFCAAAEVESEVHETTWRAFWKTAVENRPVAEVAAELGLTVGNLYSAKCRVLARIRARIKSQSTGES